MKQPLWVAGGFVLLLVAAFAGVGGCMIHMPGKSFEGSPPRLTPEQQTVSGHVGRHVQVLAGDIGERNVHRFPAKLERAAVYVTEQLGQAGYEVAAQRFDANGTEVRNLVVELPGAARRDEIVVIGGHYDSAPGTPGADDNASGTAAVLELARLMQGRQLARTVRFVAFVNEEPPWFRGPAMGSVVYAKAAHARGDRIVAMLSLETVGYYRDAPGTQHYPAPFSWFYPNRAHFIGFVGNLKSRPLVRQVVGRFREDATLPSEGVAAPGWIQGVDWSDHWSFWEEGYQAVMVTDTAPFRNPHYHEPTDTPDRVDPDLVARVVTGLVPVIEALASE